MASRSKLKFPTNEIHIHKLVQLHNITYEAAYRAYGHLMNEKGMILTEHFKFNKL